MLHHSRDTLCVDIYLPDSKPLILFTLAPMTSVVSIFSTDDTFGISLQRTKNPAV
jgi:hypothetical protein